MSQLPTATVQTANNIKGIIVNSGLQKSIEAQAREGWKIYPRAFAISEILGLFDTIRDTRSMQETWYEGPISGVVVQGVNTLEFICTIPPGVTAENKYIREIYVTALTQNDEPFLLGLGQIEGDVMYNPAGTTKLRILITIQNVNISGLYEFKYTQASEIEDHNNDPNAHPALRNLLSGAAGSTTVNNNYYSSIGDTIYVDSRSNPVTVTLPTPTASTQLGSFVKVVDVGLAAATAGREIIVNRNGALIDEREENFRIDTAGGAVTFHWYPTKKSWMVDIGGRFYREGPDKFSPGMLRLTDYLNPATLFQTGSFAPGYVDPSGGDFTATSGQVLFIDVSEAPQTVYLPKNPNSGERIQIIDSRRNASVNNITVTGNTRRINGVTANFVMNVDGMMATFIWDDATSNWCVEVGGSTTGYLMRSGDNLTPRPDGFAGTRNIVPNANNQGSIGTSAMRWGRGYFQDLTATNVIEGTALKSKYADLAENYIWMDDDYPHPGTLVTASKDNVPQGVVKARKGDLVIGIISTNPGMVIGADLEAEPEGAHKIVPVAMVGRVPVRTRGEVKHSDKLVLDDNGYARAKTASDPDTIQVVAMALHGSQNDLTMSVIC